MAANESGSVIIAGVRTPIGRFHGALAPLSSTELGTIVIREAVARLEQAHYLWLPTLYLGVDYLRHDGQIQDVAGRVFTTSRSAFMAGAGPSAVFATTDAVFAPLAGAQVVKASEAQFQAASNDTLLAVAEAYLDVQQARGELLGALAEQLGELPLLVLAAYRSDGLPRDHTLRLLRQELRRAGRFDELTLAPLALAETAELLAQALGSEPAPSIARLMAHGTLMLA